MKARCARWGGRPSQTHDIAVGLIYQAMHTQASVLAYIDVFHICAVAAFIVAPFTFLFSNYKPSPGARPTAGH